MLGQHNDNFSNVKAARIVKRHKISASAALTCRTRVSVFLLISARTLFFIQKWPPRAGSSESPSWKERSIAHMCIYRDSAHVCIIYLCIGDVYVHICILLVFAVGHNSPEPTAAALGLVLQRCSRKSGLLPVSDAARVL